MVPLRFGLCDTVAFLTPPRVSLAVSLPQRLTHAEASAVLSEPSLRFTPRLIRGLVTRNSVWRPVSVSKVDYNGWGGGVQRRLRD